MKLTSVEIIPDRGTDSVILSFRDPRSVNPFAVKTIIGLDSDDIFPQYHGSYGSIQYYTLMQQKREIVLRIGLNPNFQAHESYSDLRDQLYKMIATSRSGKIKLRFKNGVTSVAELSVFVTKMEAPQFEKTQEVQITMKSEEPMLKGLNPIFVISPEILDPANTIINDDKSTAPHGFKFDLEILADVSSIALTDPTAYDWFFTITPSGFTGGFDTGDILHFSSEYGNKYLYITRAGDDILLGDQIQPGSVWPILFPGINTFELTTPASLQWNSISYYQTYWGV